MINRSEIEACLQQYQDPYTHLDLIAARAIKDIVIKENEITVDLELGYPAAGIKKDIVTELEKKLQLIPYVKKITINLSWQITAHATQQNIKTLPEVKNIIAIASGKGGVGKSTTAVNLALALKAEGAQVGILDADIYGPNQPQMLGVCSQPNLGKKSGLEPVISHGIQSISIGYLIDVNTPMIWRGPMVSQALQQLLNETHWHNLDYLIIDLPPGTGDIQLTLAQKIPVSGAVIVTTPQDIALLDARKGLEMFRKVKIPVLGIIENMSLHICSHCGHQEDIFGSGGASRLAKETACELLGALPLDKSIREHADAGHPTVAINPEGTIAKIYRDIARHVAAKLSLQTKNYATKFPKIVIES